MNKRHKHADVIIAWANGEEIEFRHSVSNEWEPEGYTPTWDYWSEYRIKPEHKPDIRVKLWRHDKGFRFHLTFVFDGETKQFKTVEYHDE